MKNSLLEKLFTILRVELHRVFKEYAPEEHFFFTPSPGPIKSTMHVPTIAKNSIEDVFTRSEANLMMDRMEQEHFILSDDEMDEKKPLVSAKTAAVKLADRVEKYLSGRKKGCKVACRPLQRVPGYHFVEVDVDTETGICTSISLRREIPPDGTKRQSVWYYEFLFGASE